MCRFITLKDLKTGQKIEILEAGTVVQWVKPPPSQKIKVFGTILDSAFNTLSGFWPTS